MFDRFTLDEVSAKIWWPLAMVALVALVLTVPAANHAADRARRESAATATLISTRQIEPLTSRGASVDEISNTLAQIQRANPVYDAVRVWGTNKLLIASSARPDPLAGGTAGVNDADIDGAMSTGSRMDVTDRQPTGDTGPVRVHTFVKIDGATQPEITEFEANDATLLAQVHHDWNGYRIVAAAAFLLLLLLALLSMREPAADIGFGVPFYPASLPPNLAIVEAERAVLIEHEDDHVRQRVASLQQRLDESERQRLKAEAQLQQALTTLGTGGRNVPGLPPEPPTPTVPPSRATRRRPARTVEPLTAPPASKPAVEPLTPPLAAPTPIPTSPPAVQPAAAAASASPTHTPKKRSRPNTEKPAAEATPTPRRSRADEPSDAPVAPVPTRERVTVSADDVTVTAQPAASTPKSVEAREPRPEVVVLPADSPAPVGATKAAFATAPTEAPATSPDADPGSEVPHRLVPDASAEPPEPLADPGDLRARLARTAALKKPGSKERQDQGEGLQRRSSEQ